MQPYSLYIHIPFCQHRCAYCDFNTYAGLEAFLPSYVEALCKEIEWAADKANPRLFVHTIYFGGGTPSLLRVEDVESILTTIREHYELHPELEITLESNPGTVTPAYLSDLNKLGINRLSLGMQSANQWELTMLERQHDFGDVIRAIGSARKAGFRNINLDLIFGLPDQTLDDWKRNLASAISLEIEHLSLYNLTLEHGTPMEHWVNRGLLNEPDVDISADMYEYAMGHLGSEGYEQYEISNWARTDHAGNLITCRHNIQYWRNLPYIGIGAGAHGFAKNMRIANTLSPVKYIQHFLNAREADDRSFPNSPASVEVRQLTTEEIMSDTMIMGLRLTIEGVSKKTFRERYGLELERVYSTEIDELIALNLLEWVGEDGDNLRLTPEGRLLGNQAFIRFV